MRPVEFVQLITFHPEIPVRKACYNSIEQTMYIWESNTDNIHIYKDGMRINTIGGKGTGNTNFFKLSDICLAPDGDLFALDSFDNSLKKFNKTGKLAGKLQLGSDHDPKLVVIALDQKIYIYDDKRNEIIILDYKGNEIDSWDNLQSGEIECLELSDDLVAVYDLENDETIFYSTYGQLIDQHNGHCYRENGQLFSLRQYFLEQDNDRSRFALNTKIWQRAFFQAPEIILYDGETLSAGKIRYEKY